MAGYIAEFFGYAAEDQSDIAGRAAQLCCCPFTNQTCAKRLARTGAAAGVCAVRAKTIGSPAVICCPIRLYADNYRLLHTIAADAFCLTLPLAPSVKAVELARQRGAAVAVFGKGWGGELRLPQRKGTGSYFVDWVLARLDDRGALQEFTAIEVQTIDTTGNYQAAREALLRNRSVVDCPVGLNWENVNKRIIPQLIYKGQVLQREELCRSGLYFVAPQPVLQRVVARLGGSDRLPQFPKQPASIHFLGYDAAAGERPAGETARLEVVERLSTTVYKVQEAFSALTLPEQNVYRDAILRSLGL